ncbi:YeeE/YedE thiosulfate transporter family protein [uncultured Desulfosarcina sp.]|uniref:YeeE/YedE thiosulfate transporter family protein n=1 Tax=uncultured Desulfosarcina sp. TaxID=218289 RepID=UPI0029C7F35D|nr:YeeE/YedE thiosulfate transporter family protein [uncultured Desulfosarcina sp.]
MSLLYGLITGVLFGILLQRAEVLRFDRQVGALRLKDMTIFKFMLSAIVVGAVGIYLLKDFGLITLNLKGTSLGAQMIGGALFGIGWAILGYCPGTAGGALGEGRTDAAWGILGMLAGGAVHAWAYPLLKTYIEPIGNFGKITVPQLLGINHWIVIFGFTALVIGFFALFEKKRL